MAHIYNINYNILNVIHNRLWNKTRNMISNNTNDEINKHVLINILDIHNKSIEPISFNINEILRDSNEKNIINDEK